MAYTMTLADGSKLEGLGLNGNNWTSRRKITSEQLDGNLAEVHITGSGDAGELDETWHHCELVQLKKYGSEWWLILRERSPEELAAEKLRGDVDFIAMMTDVELDG